MTYSTSHELVRGLFADVFNGGRLELCDELIAEDYIEHATAPFGREAPGRVHGPSHQRGVVEWLRTQYPDLEMTLLAIVAEDAQVVVHVRSTGTNLGAINGVIPPTGRTATAEQMHRYRIAEGRLAEHWAVRDDLGMFAQLGLIPGGPPA